MDPRYSGQDVVRCTLCKTAVAPMYCSVCNIYLCKDCVEKHFSDKSKAHNVMPLEQFLSTPKCVDHPTKQCELHCEECDVPVCSRCILSKKHEKHAVVDVTENYQEKQKRLREDIKELQELIFPKYQAAASNILVQRGDQRKHSQKLKAMLKTQGDALHKEIDIIIHNMQSKIDEMDSKYLSDIDKHEDKINQTIDEISEIILNLRRLLNSNDVSVVSKYKSRNSEFRAMPPKLKVRFPNLQLQKINREKLVEQIGFLSSLSIETDKQNYTLHTLGPDFCPQGRPLLDAPRLMTDISTPYSRLFGLARLRDDELWISGTSKIMQLYNIKGELLKSVQTVSGKDPEDITVTQSGDLVYTDLYDQSINVVRNTGIRPLVQLHGWAPRGVCCTSTGDICVIMDSTDNVCKQARVVRYSDSTEKQTIQWDDQGKPLYSSGFFKYLCENTNLDICAADAGGGAIVVVSAAGNFRFRYTGPPFTAKGSFFPRGIATDSQGRILTSDYKNDCIHILDQDGHFFRYIDNIGLHFPYGLCVDSRDNLFVSEWRDTGKVKKIQYYA